MNLKPWFKSKNTQEKVAQIKHNFKAEVKEDGSNEIMIYGDIGDSWLWESTSATDLKNELDKMTGDVTIRLNSAGGDAFDGIAIYNLLKNHDGKVTIYVDGWAASAASIIATSADELIMGTGTMLMVHEAWTIALGNKTDIQKTMNALEGLDGSLADIYMTKFKGEREEIETMMTNETWFTSSEAVDVGFADKVTNDEEGTHDPEAFKESVMARFRTKPAASTNESILNKLKRQ